MIWEIFCCIFVSLVYLSLKLLVVSFVHFLLILLLLMASCYYIIYLSILPLPFGDNLNILPPITFIYFYFYYVLYFTYSSF